MCTINAALTALGCSSDAGRNAPADEAVNATAAAYTLLLPKEAMMNATTPPVVAVAQQPLDKKLVTVGIGLNGQLFAYHELGDDASAPQWSDYSALPYLRVGFFGEPDPSLVATSKPVLVALADGTLAVFVRGSDSGIHYSVQEKPDGAFGDFQDLGGQSNGAPSVARNTDGSLELFVVGTDERLYSRRSSSASPLTWSAWAVVTGGLAAAQQPLIRSNPVAITRSDGTIDVYARAEDDSLIHARQTSAGNDAFLWTQLGGIFAGDPAPVEGAVFVTAINQSGIGEIWKTTSDTSHWELVASSPTGQSILTAPVIQPLANQSYWVWVAAKDRHLWRFDVAKQTWSNQAGIVSSGLALWSAPASQSAHVFVRGKSTALYHYDEPGGWGELGGGFELASQDKPAADPNLLTQRGDNGRTGWNANETVLDVSNVSAHSFGRVGTIKLPTSATRPGQVYAQPLYVANLTITQGPYANTAHNTLILATEDNTLLAVDADTLTEVLWQRDFGAMGEFPVPTNNADLDTCFGTSKTAVNILPNIGITSTPAIDLGANTIYVTTFSSTVDYTGVDRCANPPNGQYAHKLHAIDLTSGSERLNSPVKIATPSGMPGTAFSAQHQIQRPGLLLANGSVYVAFGSQSDLGPWRGWLFAYHASDLGLVGAFSPALKGGGFWMAGQGLAADSSGVYGLVGNGTQQAGEANYYGESFLRMPFGPGGSSAASWAPASYWQVPWFATLDAQDGDLASSGVLLVPNTSFIVGGGKQGVLWVRDRTNLTVEHDAFFAGYMRDDGARNGQRNHIHGSPAYWLSPQGHRIYIWPEYEAPKAFALGADGSVPADSPPSFTRKGIQTAAPLWGQWDSWTPTAPCWPVKPTDCNATNRVPKFGKPDSLWLEQASAPVEGMPGGMISVSSNGSLAGTGIVWATHSGNDPSVNAVCHAKDPDPQNRSATWGTLYAFDAMDMNKVLYTSEMNPSRDGLGAFQKFTVPTVANGRVYVPVRNDPSMNHGGQIAVYGLLLNQAGEEKRQEQIPK